MVVDGLPFEKMEELIKEHAIVCPDCGKKDFTGIRQFNLMFKTFQGVTESSTNEIFLRPETAQGIFVNFKNVQRTMRKKLPFGIAQIGKSFRNEITPGNFTFRTREFEQMELEFFCKPGEDLKWFNYWKNFAEQWLLTLGLNKEIIYDFVIILMMNFPITVMRQQILNTNSHLDGENFGVLLPEQIMI